MTAFSEGFKAGYRAGRVAGARRVQAAVTRVAEERCWQESAEIDDEAMQALFAETRRRVEESVA